MTSGGGTLLLGGRGGAGGGCSTLTSRATSFDARSRGPHTKSNVQGTETGYAIYGGVFESAEMMRMISALDRSDVVRTRAGARHVLAVPAVRALATDSRLMEIARQFVGSSVVAFRATLFGDVLSLEMAR